MARALLSRSYGFNPGFGMQTTNVEAGTETLFHLRLCAPVGKAGAPTAPQLDDGDQVLLMTTKTCNKITRLEVINKSATDFLGSFFFAYLKDGKVKYPKYGDGAPCFKSLGAAVDNAGTAFVKLKVAAGHTDDLWSRAGEVKKNDGSGSLVACCARAAESAAGGNYVLPQTYDNIGALLTAALRNGGNGLSGMGVADTDVVICCNLEGDIPQASAENIIIKIGIIETDISVRNETEGYVKNWNQIPAAGVVPGDGISLPYDPAE